MNEIPPIQETDILKAEQLLNACAELAVPGLWEPSQTIFKDSGGFYCVATRYLPVMFEKRPKLRVIPCKGSTDYDGWFLTGCGIRW
jgi:hypothetical protein